MEAAEEAIHASDSSLGNRPENQPTTCPPAGQKGEGLFVAKCSSGWRPPLVAIGGESRVGTLAQVQTPIASTKAAGDPNSYPFSNPFYRYFSIPLSPRSSQQVATGGSGAAAAGAPEALAAGRRMGPCVASWHA